MKSRLLRAALALGVAVAGVSPAARAADPVRAHSPIATLEARIAALEAQQRAPELGQQMLALQIRHDRLWWAGEAGNWNLAYFMIGELGETLRGIEATNGEAPEVQPEKLSDLMPAKMNPAIRGVQQALERRDRAGFARAYDGLSAACTSCHEAAGVGFLHIQRPKSPLLDNLRYTPAAN